MNEIAYTNRLKRQLERKKISLDESALAEVVRTNFGLFPPSVVAQQMAPKSTNRKDKKVAAETRFDEVLKATCDAFALDVKFAATKFDDNWRDLRSAASFIGLDKLKLRPASAMAVKMGLDKPAGVYHAAYRGKRLMKERTLFKAAVRNAMDTLQIKYRK